jgi:hypothetical protein
VGLPGPALGRRCLLDFLDHLVDWAADVPLLVVATARPELLGRRPGWGGGKPSTTIVSLVPLSEQDIARLVAALLGQAVLPVELQTALLVRAGGNPLYAEEYVRMLDARLDALGLDEKSLLQDAAVLGKVGWLGALVTLASNLTLSGRHEEAIEVGRQPTATSASPDSSPPTSAESRTSSRPSGSPWRRTRCRLRLPTATSRVPAAALATLLGASNSAPRPRRRLSASGSYAISVCLMRSGSSRTTGGAAGMWPFVVPISSSPSRRQVRETSRSLAAGSFGGGFGWRVASW